MALDPCLKARAHVGDAGTILEKEFIDQDGDPVSLVGATTIDLHVETIKGEDPSVLAGVIVNPPGTDGIARFTTVAGTWTKKGIWLEQGHIVNPSGDWVGYVEQRIVHPRIF